MLQVQWTKCEPDSHWCTFETVNLSNVIAHGVYIIWHDGDPSRVVRVGQGDIKTRLTAHRADQDILAYKKNGVLRVTWASVSASNQDGVERYLADQWPPLVGDAFPDVQPIAVNSPWG